MHIRLVSVGSDLKATEIPLELPTLIGRGCEAALTLPHPLVSRRHCELYERQGRLRVRDLGSLNGTFVGSEQVTDAEVPSGELLTVATLNFRVVYGEATSACAAESPLLIGNDESTYHSGRLEHVVRRTAPPATTESAETDAALTDLAAPVASAGQTADEPIEWETRLPIGRRHRGS
jgi:pSer/pThr/pTyr-binding forkhead associated (FHA) protein